MTKQVFKLKVVVQVTANAPVEVDEQNQSFIIDGKEYFLNLCLATERKGRGYKHLNDEQFASLGLEPYVYQEITITPVPYDQRELVWGYDL